MIPQLDLRTWNKCEMIYNIMDKDFGRKESLKERIAILNSLCSYHCISLADMKFYIDRREGLLE